MKIINETGHKFQINGSKKNLSQLVEENYFKDDKKKLTNEELFNLAKEKDSEFFKLKQFYSFQANHSASLKNGKITISRYDDKNLNKNESQQNEKQEEYKKVSIHFLSVAKLFLEEYFDKSAFARYVILKVINETGYEFEINGNEKNLSQLVKDGHFGEEIKKKIKTGQEENENELNGFKQYKNQEKNYLKKRNLSQLVEELVEDVHFGEEIKKKIKTGQEENENELNDFEQKGNKDSAPGKEVKINQEEPCKKLFMNESGQQNKK